MRVLVSALGALFALYLIGGAALYWRQRDFLYPVDLLDKRARPPAPPFALERIATPDGEALRAWHAPPGRDRFPTILFFHGNGDTLEGLSPRLTALAGRGYGVLAVAFRGYPGSTGKPSETGLTADAFAALEWLVAHNVAENRIVAFGRSLGSGLAVKIAAARKPGAVILEAAYSSIAAVAQKQFPWYPAALLLRDPYRSIDLMDRISAPLLAIHGAEDGLIPPAMAQALHDRAGSALKEIAITPHAGHDDLDAFGLVDRVDAFLRRVYSL